MFVLTGRRYSPLWRGRRGSGSKGWLVTWLPQSGSRETGALVPDSLSPFSVVWNPIPQDRVTCNYANSPVSVMVSIAIIKHHDLF